MRADMEYLNIELDEYRRISRSGRIFNIVLGFGTILLSALVIYKRIAGGQPFGEYFVFVLLIILGINILLYTFGIFYHISRRYVIIDDQSVEYKLYYFSPSRKISWSSVKRVDIRTLRIFFVTSGGSSYRMKLGEMFYHDIRILKRTLAAICTEKSIEWSDTTVESMS
jgi:hypothetical protein